MENSTQLAVAISLEIQRREHIYNDVDRFYSKGKSVTYDKVYTNTQVNPTGQDKVVIEVNALYNLFSTDDSNLDNLGKTLIEFIKSIGLNSNRVEEFYTPFYRH